MPIELGYKRGFASKYSISKRIGVGGNGTVFICTKKSTGEEFAVKVIPKINKDPKCSDRKKELQIPSIKQEIEVLLALRGSLNVANLEEVFEDDNDVQIVMEYCRGGELLGHAKRGARYSERTVASILRSVLQTVAQCHAKGILHRDIKAENFLMLNTTNDSPIKAIDFGLATFFEPSKLPVTAITPEGTVWFLAPESCRAKWYPASDVWACGVLACYMLTGFYPFVDRFMPTMPDMARTLKVICFEEFNPKGAAWDALSADAIDFVSSLLVKDPMKRPSAVEALKHPWFQDPDQSKAAQARPLHKSVVQRIQRYSQSSLFKRTILAHIADDLVSMHFSAEGSVHGRAVVRERSVRGGSQYYNDSVHSKYSGGDGSVKNRSTRNPSFRGFFTKGTKTDRSVTARSQSGYPDASYQGSVGGSMHGGRLLASGYLPIATPFSRRLVHLLETIDINSDGKIDREELRIALKKLGYKINDMEADELFDVVDVHHHGEVTKSEVAASLMDWRSVQDTYKDRWLESVKKAFNELDRSGAGVITAGDIASSFGMQLTDYEVDAAVHEALIDALGEEAATVGVGGEQQQQEPTDVPRIDFDHFLALLQNSGADDLDLFDERLSNHTSRHPSCELPPVGEWSCGDALRKFFSCGA